MALFGTLGTMAMGLVAGTVETKIDFDAGAAEPGWNKLGEYDIGAGPGSAGDRFRVASSS